MDVRESYDSAAEGYARALVGELDAKPLDRHLLNRFAEETRGRGLVADLGCGPGHVARYLRDRGVDAFGVDLSPGMVRVAARLHPGIGFRVGDMGGLDIPDAALAGVVASYAIVHHAPADLAAPLAEIRRVLASGAPALVSFHVGDRVVRVDDLFGAPVALDFHFHDPSTVARALASAGLPVVEHSEREPYDGSEYPSRRCFLLARAT